MKEGVDEIGFWYQPPGSGPAGATWALVVKASAGHVPVNVDAGEDYTAETAQLRTGDNLLVTIDDASNGGRHSWQMIGGSPLVKLVSQKFSQRHPADDLRRRVRGHRDARPREPAERRSAAADLRAAAGRQGARRLR